MQRYSSLKMSSVAFGWSEGTRKLFWERRRTPQFSQRAVRWDGRENTRGRCCCSGEFDRFESPVWLSKLFLDVTVVTICIGAGFVELCDDAQDIFALSYSSFGCLFGVLHSNVSQSLASGGAFARSRSLTHYCEIKPGCKEKRWCGKKLWKRILIQTRSPAGPSCLSWR